MTYSIENELIIFTLALGATLHTVLGPPIMDTIDLGGGIKLSAGPVQPVVRV